MKWVILLILCTLLMGIRAVRPAAGQEGIAPDPRFGMTEAFWEPEEATELRVGWDRILFYWRELQPNGPDDWNTLHVREEWLSEAKAQGRTVVGLIKNTAPWASVDGTEAGLPKGLYLPIDDRENLWAGFVRKVANYYSDRNVHHWIIWNEPEIRPGVYGYEFAGTTQDYYQLLKVAYKVMKEEDPAAIIHLAGLTWWHDQTFLRRLLDIAAADPEASANNSFFDVISLHIYFRTETIPIIFNSIQAAQRDHGLDKPIWVNETNAPPNLDPAWPVIRPAFPVDLDQQAWFLIQSYALGYAEGAGSIGVYKLIDVHLPAGAESFGVMRPDFSRRPSFEAYKTVTRYMDRFSATYKQTDPKYYVVAFARPSGVTRVIWARTAAPVELRLPAIAGSGRLIGPTGAETPMTVENGAYAVRLDGARCTGECIIGGPPLFLFEQARMPAGGPAPASNYDPESGVTLATVSLNTTSSATPAPTETPSATPTATLLPTETPRPTDSPVESDASALASAPLPLETPRPVATGFTEIIVDPPASSTGQESEETQYLAILLLVGGAIGLSLVTILLLVWRRQGRDTLD
jgi:hypothetical protein